MSHKTLLQKDMHSCKELYLQGNKSFDKVEVAKKFIELWYYTKEIDIVRAMDRRMNDLVMIWLLSVKFLEKNNYYLTDHWRRVKTDKIHLWVTLVIRDNKESDVCKKASPDRKPRKSKEEVLVKNESKEWNDYVKFEWDWLQIKLRNPIKKTNVKSENKVLNTIDFWVDKFKKWYEVYNHKFWETDSEIMSWNNTELINTNKGTPKHSLREHIKSFF